MTITIRHENIHDYFAIAEIHASAFDYGYGMGEVLLVDAQRHGQSFDPELSLVAELDGRIVGHVLFTPLKVSLYGVEQKAINLAPIAIHPDFQNKGIGSLLIKEGHKRCINKGYDFSILLGHPNYYSRFGYQSNMFGTNAIEIERKTIQSNQNNLQSRRVSQKDIPMLMSMWEKVHGNNSLTIKPGDSIVDWISTSQSITSAIIEADGQPVGYVRYETHHPKNILVFLVNDRSDAIKVIEYLNGMVNTVETSLTLPVPAYAKSTVHLISYPFKEKVNPWDAGMICILNDNNQHITSYCKEIIEDKKRIGFISWPVEFENC